MDKLTGAQVFTKVAKAGRYVAAATEMGISRAMATKHIMQLVVCGSPSYFEKFGCPENPEKLDEHNCLVNWDLAPGDAWRFNCDGEEQTIKVTGNFQSNVANAARLSAINGLGLTILPTYMVGQDIQKGRLRVVLEEFEFLSGEIYAVYPRRRHLSAKVRTFVDFMRERLQPTPYWDS